MKWVLILIITGYGNMPPAITTVDFSSAEACHRAFSELHTQGGYISGTCINKETGESSESTKP